MATVPFFGAMDASFIFGTKDDINAWQECARALVIFVYGLLAIRLVGRRIFGKWSAIDFVVSVVVGSALGRVLTGGAFVGPTLAACTLLLLLHWALAHYAARHKLFSWILEGDPVILSEDGKLRHNEMLKHNITNADLAEALRGRGIEDVTDTERITAEPSGKITIVPKKKRQPPSRKSG